MDKKTKPSLKWVFKFLFFLKNYIDVSQGIHFSTFSDLKTRKLYIERFTEKKTALFLGGFK